MLSLRNELHQQLRCTAAQLCVVWLSKLAALLIEPVRFGRLCSSGRFQHHGPNMLSIHLKTKDTAHRYSQMAHASPPHTHIHITFDLSRRVSKNSFSSYTHEAAVFLNGPETGTNSTSRFTGRENKSVMRSLPLTTHVIRRGTTILLQVGPAPPLSLSLPPA